MQEVCDQLAMLTVYDVESGLFVHNIISRFYLCFENVSE